MQCWCSPQSLLSERFPGRTTTPTCWSQCTTVGGDDDSGVGLHRTATRWCSLPNGCPDYFGTFKVNFWKRYMLCALVMQHWLYFIFLKCCFKKNVFVQFSYHVLNKTALSLKNCHCVYFSVSLFSVASRRVSCQIFVYPKSIRVIISTFVIYTVYYCIIIKKK